MAREENSQVIALKKRIKYDANIFVKQADYDEIIDCLIEDSKNIALATLFPFEDYSLMELPIKYNNWQLRACIELYNMADKSLFVKYSENGVDFQKLTDGLSISLMNELTPRAGVPRKNEVI